MPDGAADIRRLVLQHDVMGAALDDARGRNDRQLGLLLQFGNRDGAAVAHGRFDFSKRDGHIVFQRTSVGYV